jgi:hypothetical protein
MNLKDFEAMKSERWRQIRRIFDDAAKLAPANRAAFLRENCKADEDLHREIELLLSSYNNAESFMEQPAVGKVAGMMSLSGFLCALERRRCGYSNSD